MLSTSKTLHCQCASTSPHPLARSSYHNIRISSSSSSSRRGARLQVSRLPAVDRVQTQEHTPQQQGKPSTSGPEYCNSYSSSSSSSSNNSSSSSVAPRRGILFGAALSCLAASQAQLAPSSQAVVFAPPGYRVKDDKLDGYTFFYPEGWLPVTSSGNDCFLRNPRNIDENLFVDITSPSSSTYQTVTELGSPEDTANLKLDQFLNKEFMSTRLGIRREGKVLFSETRVGNDGRTYYDIGIRMSSYGSRNPYVATQGEVLQDYGIEWDRVLLTTLGVANKRVYELRMQTAQETYGGSKPRLDQIKDSFVLRDVDTAGS